MHKERQCLTLPLSLTIAHRAHPQVTIKGNTCTVTPLGGAEDDSSALLYAFNEACQHDSTIELPGSYVVAKVLNTTLERVTVNLRCVALRYTQAFRGATC